MKLTVTELAQFQADSKMVSNHVERTRDIGSTQDTWVSEAVRRIRRLSDRLMGTEVRIS